MTLRQKNIDTELLRSIVLYIDFFSKGNVPVQEILYDIEGNLNNLKTVEKDWVESFRSKWLDVETIYALFLDSENSKMSDQNIKEIRIALQQLKKMALEQIKIVNKERYTCIEYIKTLEDFVGPKAVEDILILIDDYDKDAHEYPYESVAVDFLIDKIVETKTSLSSILFEKLEYIAEHLTVDEKVNKRVQSIKQQVQ